MVFEYKRSLSASITFKNFVKNIFESKKNYRKIIVKHKNYRKILRWHFSTSLNTLHVSIVIKLGRSSSYWVFIRKFKTVVNKFWRIFQKSFHFTFHHQSSRRRLNKRSELQNKEHENEKETSCVVRNYNSSIKSMLTFGQVLKPNKFQSIGIRLRLPVVGW